MPSSPLIGIKIGLSDWDAKVLFPIFSTPSNMILGARKRVSLVMEARLKDILP
jgi:hypothetical protein